MDDLVLIDQQQVVTLLGKCDQPVGKAALGEQAIEHLIALPDKAVLEISRSCDFLLQRREDRQIDRFLVVLAFSDKQPFILAVNRRYGRADYLPCIAWGKVAAKIAEMQVGDRLTLEGRVQSRTYIKQTDAGSEERTAYEVSVMQLLDDEETELI